MSEMFSKLNGGEFLGLCGILLGLIAVIGGVATGLATLVAIYKRRVQLDEMEATLKMEMIQRGMSASEITQVLEAKMSSAKGVSWKEMIKSPRMPAVLGKPLENT